MDCQLCDEIFERIKNIDSQVKLYEDAKNYYQYRLEYVQMAGIHKEAIKIIRERYNTAYENWIIAREQQQDIHKSLTKHYREIHLNGENNSV